jgi:hypothetical protein
MIVPQLSIRAMAGAVLFLSVAWIRAEPPTRKPDSTNGTKISKEQAEWEAQVPERFLIRARNEPQMATAFAFVEDDPRLPRVLLIGDSISILYTGQVRQLLANEANVHRIPDNAGNTGFGLKKIDQWLGDGRWDVIHFNWGLHDLVGPINQKGKHAVEPDQYGKNLEELIVRLGKTGATLIFATTTPVPEGERGRQAGEEQIYNDVALRVMKRHHIQVDDLCTAIRPHVAEYQAHHDVHFGVPGSEFLAEQIAPLIRQALAARKH